MAISNKSRKEVINTVPESNYYQILSDEQYQHTYPLLSNNTKPNLRTINEEINRRATKIRYSKIAAPAPRYISPLPSPMVMDPSKPVFEYKSFQKVSQLEKVLSAFTNQMVTLLTDLKSEKGLNIINQFQKALNLESHVTTILNNNVDSEHSTT